MIHIQIDSSKDVNKCQTVYQRWAFYCVFFIESVYRMVRLYGTCI